MAVYLVDEDRVMMNVQTSKDLAVLLASAPLNLEDLEADMLKMDCQESVPVIHRFAPGLYIREAHLRAGLLLLGHTQKEPQFNVMTSGHVTMDNGQELIAPMAFNGWPGRKCGVIHEDTVWMNIYATEEQDIGVLEDRFMRKTDAAAEAERRRSGFITQDVVDALADYPLMLADVGFTAEDVSGMSKYTGDRIPLPWGAYKFRTAPSPIHGAGVFASAPIEPGEIIGPASINGCRTVLGYAVNHSGNPNAKMVLRKNGADVVAISSIGGNRGGFCGDEITVDYRESRRVAKCLA